MMHWWCEWVSCSIRMLWFFGCRNLIWVCLRGELAYWISRNRSWLIIPRFFIPSRCDSRIFYFNLLVLLLPGFWYRSKIKWKATKICLFCIHTKHSVSSAELILACTSWTRSQALETEAPLPMESAAYPRMAPVLLSCHDLSSQVYLDGSAHNGQLGPSRDF